jgi:hypothetical protein
MNTFIANHGSDHRGTMPHSKIAFLFSVDCITLTAHLSHYFNYSPASCAVQQQYQHRLGRTLAVYTARAGSWCMLHNGLEQARAFVMNCAISNPKPTAISAQLDSVAPKFLVRYEVKEGNGHKPKNL